MRRYDKTLDIFILGSDRQGESRNEDETRRNAWNAEYVQAIGWKIPVSCNSIILHISAICKKTFIGITN